MMLTRRIYYYFVIYLNSKLFHKEFKANGANISIATHTWKNASSEYSLFFSLPSGVWAKATSFFSREVLASRTMRWNGEPSGPGPLPTLLKGLIFRSGGARACGNLRAERGLEATAIRRCFRSRDLCSWGGQRGEGGDGGQIFKRLFLGDSQGPCGTCQCHACGSFLFIY